MRLDPEQVRRLLGDAAPATCDNESCPRHAAVLVPLVFRAQTHILLIRRAERGDPWSGQVAFPGGGIEPTDDSGWAAACRETHEEIGIKPKAIAPLGGLGLFPTNSRRVLVQAFVGAWDGVGELHPSPREVAAVLECPLAGLWGAHRADGLGGQTSADLGERLVYPSPAGVIWGVTARILHHFFEAIAPLWT